MRAVWSKHGEAITTVTCALFVVAGALVDRTGDAVWLADGLFLVGYIAGGYRQAIEGTTKLVRERLYDAACFLMSNATDGPKGRYREPAPELNFQNFIASLAAKAIAVAKTEK